MSTAVQGCGESQAGQPSEDGTNFVLASVTKLRLSGLASLKTLNLSCRHVFWDVASHPGASQTGRCVALSRDVSPVNASRLASNLLHITTMSTHAEHFLTVRTLQPPTRNATVNVIRRRPRSHREAAPSI